MDTRVMEQKEQNPASAIPPLPHTEEPPASLTTIADLVMNREPEEVLFEAQKAAQALKEIMAKKARPITFNGEQYLEFEDWQTLAKFYGITAKGVETRYVEFGGVRGFEARAVAVHLPTGREISGAEALCLNDERNWSHKPLFQLKSMAQTRACAKALRNVLAWVVVLAGYRPTPAEEMTGMETGPQGYNQISQARTGGLPSDSEDIVSRFLKVNAEFASMYGPNAYKEYLHNSKGESPSIERIKTFNTPKQLAWLRTALTAMEGQLKQSRH